MCDPTGKKWICFWITRASFSRTLSPVCSDSRVDPLRSQSSSSSSSPPSSLPVRPSSGPVSRHALSLTSPCCAFSCRHAEEVARPSGRLPLHLALVFCTCPPPAPASAPSLSLRVPYRPASLRPVTPHPLGSFFPFLVSLLARLASRASCSLVTLLVSARPLPLLPSPVPRSPPLAALS